MRILILLLAFTILIINPINAIECDNFEADFFNYYYASSLVLINGFEYSDVLEIDDFLKILFELNGQEYKDVIEYMLIDLEDKYAECDINIDAKQNALSKLELLRGVTEHLNLSAKITSFDPTRSSPFNGFVYKNESVNFEVTQEVLNLIETIGNREISEFSDVTDYETRTLDNTDTVVETDTSQVNNNGPSEVVDLSEDKPKYTATKISTPKEEPVNYGLLIMAVLFIYYIAQSKRK